MQLTPSDIYTLLRKPRCDLRVYLRHRSEEESPPGPYEEVLRRLGERHEKRHLGTLGPFVDLSSGTREKREIRTQEEVAKSTAVIYQPALRATTNIDGTECHVVGDPDFLILEDDGYILRDAKISRRITEEHHPEIMRQMEIYSWLYEQTFGRPPLRLEVFSGTGQTVDVPYGGGTKALELLQEVLLVKLADSEPYTPVGWSKCGGCSFRDRCWPLAENRRDVALVYRVDQGLTHALRQAGIETTDQLLAAFNEGSLAEFRKPHGSGTRRVGKRARTILQMARAMVSGKELLLKIPQIPDLENYVMFDLEGLPPQLDELEKIYLWGIQVFGSNPSDFVASVAGFGTDGDKDGWRDFLVQARQVFDQYGDLPFVHWHSYEKTNLEKYISRYGDIDGVGAKVLHNLLDLLPVFRASVALPIPSYSLKQVEQYVGYKRTLEEYGGNWAMAKYIEATETEDEKIRNEVMDQILTYNHEDLQATWAVMQWLKQKATS